MNLRQKIKTIVREALNEDRKFFKSDEESSDWLNEFLRHKMRRLLDNGETFQIFYVEPKDLPKFIEAQNAYDEESGEEIDSYISGVGPWITTEESFSHANPTLKAALLKVKSDPGTFMSEETDALEFIPRIIKILGLEQKAKSLLVGPGRATFDSFEALYRALKK